MKSWENYETFEERLPNHVFIQRVADAAGVSTQSVHRVAKKRLQKEGKRDRKRLKGCPYTFVSLSLWDEYMEIGPVKRVAAKPKGWLTAKALLEDGFSKRKLYQLVREGSVKAVYVGNTLYLEPESAWRYIQTRQDLRPPPGWVSVSELRERAGRSKQALSTYLKRHQVETAQFLHPKRDQLVQYIRSEDAQNYLGCQGGVCVSETAQLDAQETASINVSENTQNDLQNDPAIDTAMTCDLGAAFEAPSAEQCSEVFVDEVFVDNEPHVSPASPVAQPASQPVSQPSEVLMGLAYATNTLHGGIAARGSATQGMTSSRLPGYNERETSMRRSHPSFVLPRYGSGQHHDPGQPSPGQTPDTGPNSQPDVLQPSVLQPSVLQPSVLAARHARPVCAQPLNYHD
jgi:hypothetical protein